MDSGIRGGADVARVLGVGADFTFLGRSFMYGVSALGSKGGTHTISVIKKQLKQIMEQLGCSKIKDFVDTRIYLWFIQLKFKFYPNLLTEIIIYKYQTVKVC